MSDDVIVWVSDWRAPVIAGGMYPDWCARCSSSSALRVRLYVLDLDGPRPVGLWWACQVCDPDRFGGDDPTDLGGGDDAVPV